MNKIRLYIILLATVMFFACSGKNHEDSSAMPTKEYSFSKVFSSSIFQDSLEVFISQSRHFPSKFEHPVNTVWIRVDNCDTLLYFITAESIYPAHIIEEYENIKELGVDTTDNSIISVSFLNCCYEELLDNPNNFSKELIIKYERGQWNKQTLPSMRLYRIHNMETLERIAIHKSIYETE